MVQVMLGFWYKLYNVCIDQVKQKDPFDNVVNYLNKILIIYSLDFTCNVCYKEVIILN